MGRFSMPLAERFADFAEVRSSGSGGPSHVRALDVGCGPGALTATLAGRLGPAFVAAVDPTPAFADAVHARLPDVDVRVADAEALPFPVASFDVALAQLVVHFMTDPDRGVAEMARVTRPGGVIAACTWDVEHDRAPHAVFLRATREVRGSAPAPLRAGTRGGDPAAVLQQAGCRDVTETTLTVEVVVPSFDEWWDAFAFGIGSSATQLAGLDAAGVAAVRARALDLTGPAPFTVSATAWAGRGIRA